MSPAEDGKHGLACPRCRSGTIEVLTNSPEENTDPDKYPAAFRLKPEDLAKFPLVPTIPPLRRS